MKPQAYILGKARFEFVDDGVGGMYQCDELDITLTRSNLIILGATPAESDLPPHPKRPIDVEEVTRLAKEIQRAEGKAEIKMPDFEVVNDLGKGTIDKKYWYWMQQITQAVNQLRKGKG